MTKMDKNHTTIAQLADDLGVSRQAIRNHIKRYGEPGGELYGHYDKIPVNGRLKIVLDDFAAEFIRDHTYGTPQAQIVPKSVYDDLADLQQENKALLMEIQRINADYRALANANAKLLQHKVDNIKLLAENTHLKDTAAAYNAANIEIRQKTAENAQLSAANEELKKAETAYVAEIYQLTAEKTDLIATTQDAKTRAELYEQKLREREEELERIKKRGFFARLFNSN